MKIWDSVYILCCELPFLCTTIWKPDTEKSGIQVFGIQMVTVIAWHGSCGGGTCEKNCFENLKFPRIMLTMKRRITIGLPLPVSWSQPEMSYQLMQRKSSCLKTTTTTCLTTRFEKQISPFNVPADALYSVHIIWVWNTRDTNYKHSINPFINKLYYSNHLNTKHLNTRQYGCPVFKW